MRGSVAKRLRKEAELASIGSPLVARQPYERTLRPDCTRARYRELKAEHHRNQQAGA